MKLFYITLGFLVLSGCIQDRLIQIPQSEQKAFKAKSNPKQSVIPEKFLLPNTEWKLTGLITPKDKIQSIKPNNIFTIQFENDYFRGKTVCNNGYGGQFLKFRNKIYVTDLKQTLMGCGSLKLDHLESQFMSVLYSRANRFEIHNNELKFYSATNKLVMRFVRLH